MAIIPRVSVMPCSHAPMLPCSHAIDKPDTTTLIPKYIQRYHYCPEKGCLSSELPPGSNCNPYKQKPDIDYYDVGIRVVYKCDTGYNALDEDEMYARCEAGGSWTYGSLQCRPLGASQYWRLSQYYTIFVESKSLGIIRVSKCRLR